ncbi:unnamed protein product [Linum trigynum]|uniref:Phosphatidylinositol-glycan biosynthesis class X protein n=1 Tax=Linum trigynum TaxID=586398 RepID=A0AAV2DRI8_9ROSI
MLPGDPNLQLTLSGLERRLIGEGSHRHLSSTIQIQVPPQSFPLQSCKLVMIERLPSGVFADPFELDHLFHHGAYAGIGVFGDTNLELPSVSSNRSAVEIHMNFEHNISSGAMSELGIRIDLPLHARYAPLHESGYSEVAFGMPDLLVNCSMEGGSEMRSCLIVPSHDSNRLRTDVVWKIPCGIMSHTNVVSVVTFATAFVSTLVIVFASVLYPKPR